MGKHLFVDDEEIRRTLTSDFDNLTLADPQVNRYEKGVKDAAEWLPELNRLWFVETEITVKKKYVLTVDRTEMEALAGVLAELDTVIRMRSFGSLKALSPGTARGE